MLGRPGRESNTATDLQDPQHLSQHDIRTRREDVAELTEHNIERGVRIRQRFRVPFDEIDVDGRHIGIVAGPIEKHR